MHDYMVYVNDAKIAIFDQQIFWYLYNKQEERHTHEWITFRFLRKNGQRKIYHRQKHFNKH